MKRLSVPRFRTAPGGAGADEPPNKDSGGRRPEQAITAVAVDNGPILAALDRLLVEQQRTNDLLEKLLRQQASRRWW